MLDHPPGAAVSSTGPGIIGRERALIDGLAKAIHGAARRRHNYTDVRESRRGSWFEVRLSDPDGNPTGHIARVTIELDRFEEIKP